MPVSIYVGAGRFQYMLGRAGCPLYCYAQPVEWASGVELASCQFQYMLGRAVGGQCLGKGWGAELIALRHCPPYISLPTLHRLSWWAVLWDGIGS
ncbi:MAG: hypothetical protein F6J90_22075 [Moorea sp. SIOASIH]|uniref:hypothetical protein n=1 Tax=Moorena sp. SIOASIH TaxID=2607817 RepID=UPI0013BCCECA|nr:hypothetical protein [Moorena sp. SIOASIH]NEO38879.1 hypothetical protein [Moorena sp. SIOASIH]